MITTVDAWPEGIEQSLAQSLAGVSTTVINAQHFDTGRASVFHVSHGLNKLQCFYGYGERAMCRVAGHDATNLFMNLG